MRSRARSVIALVAVAGAGCVTESTVRCPSGQHDGGGGQCVSAGMCSLGFGVDDSGACVAPSGDGVTLRYVDGGQPVAGVRVVWHAEDGHYLGLGETNGAGEASWAYQAPGMVTVLLPDGRDPDHPLSAQTIALEPGQSVTFSPSFAPSPAPVMVGTMHVTLPGAFSGATAYQLGNGQDVLALASAVGQTTIAVYDWQTALPAVNAILYALDGGGHPLAYALADQIDLSAVGNGPIEVTLGAWQTDLVTIPMALADTPAGLDPSTTVIASGRAQHRGAPLPVAGGSYQGSTSGSMDFATTIPRSIDGGVASYAELWTSDAYGRSTRSASTAGIPDRVTIDLEHDLLPLYQAGLTTNDDPVRPVFGFGPYGPDGKADLIFCEVIADTADQRSGIRWRFYLPGDAAEIKVPELPPELAAYQPQLDPSGWMYGYDSSAADGYPATLDLWASDATDQPVGGFERLSYYQWGD